MASGNVLRIRDLHTLTLQVRVTRGFRIRRTIGIALIQLGAWVMRMGCDVQIVGQRRG